MEKVASDGIESAGLQTKVENLKDISASSRKAYERLRELMAAQAPEAEVEEAYLLFIRFDNQRLDTLTGLQLDLDLDLTEAPGASMFLPEDAKDFGFVPKSAESLGSRYPEMVRQLNSAYAGFYENLGSLVSLESDIERMYPDFAEKMEWSKMDKEDRKLNAAFFKHKNKNWKPAI